MEHAATSAKWLVCAHTIATQWCSALTACVLNFALLTQHEQQASTTGAGMYLPCNPQV